jgi:hypothetical protein
LFSLLEEFPVPDLKMHDNVLDLGGLVVVAGLDASDVLMAELRAWQLLDRVCGIRIESVAKLFEHMNGGP